MPLAAEEPGVPSTDICDASTVIGWLGDVAPAMWPVTDWLVVLVVDREWKPSKVPGPLLVTDPLLG
jgi:hypothetical protein